MHTVFCEQVFSSPSQPYYGHILVRNRPMSTELHDHEFYEIVLLVSGRTTHRLNETTHPMDDGDIMFICPDDVHQFEGYSAVTELLSLQVRVDEMERFMDVYGAREILSAPDRPPCLHLDTSEVHALSEIYSRMVVLDDGEHLSQYRILLGRIVQCYLAHAIQGNNPVWLRMAMDQMALPANAAEGVSAFLRLSNLSHAQLCRLMKKHYGTTPQQYVKNLRLNLAHERIVSTPTDFLTISMEVGYNSFSHFCTSFKERFGLSPSELRRRSYQRLFPGSPEDCDENDK